METIEESKQRKASYYGIAMEDYKKLTTMGYVIKIEERAVILSNTVITETAIETIEQNGYEIVGIHRAREGGIRALFLKREVF